MVEVVVGVEVEVGVVVEVVVGVVVEVELKRSLGCAALC